MNASSPSSGAAARSVVDLKYRAFISYSHKDKQWADWLHKALETYKPPRKIVGLETHRGEVPGRLGRVFRDRDELPTSSDLGRKINQALSESATQVVICSPNSARSRWVNEEILAFKRLAGEDRIFCVIVDGEPGAASVPGREDRECFPPALRFKLGADGKLSAIPAEPIAADAREQGDGKANAKLKLIAGMLGVGFDDLKQREQQRRQRRLMAVAAASLVGMLITTVLAGLAVIARFEADRQRERAENEAEIARQTTDFLVGLFEVSDPSEARGNSVTAREILDKGANRIRNELDDQPRVQATLMDTMGTVYKSLGLYDRAGSLLQEALANRRVQFGERHLSVAETQAHLAEVLSLRADFGAAGPLYIEALDTRRALLGEQAPQVADTLIGYADLLTMEGEFEEAGILLQESLDIRRQVYGSEHLDVAQSLEYLGMNYLDRGDYPTSERLLRESIVMRRKLLGAEPHPALADGLNNLAFVLFDQGEFEAAGDLFRESLTMKQALYGDVHPEVAMTLNNLAFVYHDQGDLDRAESMYREVIEIRIELFGDAHPDIAVALNNLAFLLYDKGEIEAALETASRAVEMNRGIYSGDHQELANSLANLGNWLLLEHDYSRAEPLLIEALEMSGRELGYEHANVAKFRSSLSLLYLETGRYEAALEEAIEARRVLLTALPADHWRIAWAGSLEGASRTHLGEFAAAETLLVSSYENLADNPGSRPLHVRQTLLYLIDLYERWQRPAQATAYRARLDAGKI